MAGLQRSSETFRRSGSSGLVWEDRFLKDDQKDPKKAEEGGEPELRHSRSVGSVVTLERNRSNGGGGHGYKTGRVSPALDPPSPKLSGCGFCGIFSNSKQQQGPGKKKAKPGRR